MRNVAVLKEINWNPEAVLCMAVTDPKIFPELSSYLGGAVADINALWRKLEGVGKLEFWTACWSAMLCEAWLQADKATHHGGAAKRDTLERQLYKKLFLA